MKRLFTHVLVVTVLAPMAALWANYQEKRITKIGTPLEDAIYKWASSVGIKHTDRIRITVEEALHFPSPKWFKLFLERHGLCLHTAAGMCLRYGIFIHKNAYLTDRLLKHELGHTLQYERAGSLYKFMRVYLFECLYYGYDNAPMEQEADEIAATDFSR